MLVATGVLPASGSDHPGADESLTCEAFLTSASLNILRGVSAPRDHVVMEARDRSEWPKDYGMYGAESPEERRQFVCTRHADALYCRACHRTYSLVAGATDSPMDSPCVPCQ
jgi:hypothetical protein